MDLKNLQILPENSAEGLGSRKEHCWSYVVSTFKNKTKNLSGPRKGAVGA